MSTPSPSSTGERSSAHRTRKPLVPYLILPDAPDEKPYLAGTRCGACQTTFLGRRMACSKCFERAALHPIRLSSSGTVWVYSIVYQSFPGLVTPYPVAIVDLEDGCSVNATLVDVAPVPESLQFGMRVEMVTRPVSIDRDGNQVISFYFRPTGAQKPTTEGAGNSV